MVQNNNAILNANGATYSIPVASEADNGAKFKVTVATAGAAVTSDEVTLVVNPDAAVPTVTSVTVLDAYNSKVVFSEPVKDPSATAPANYTFTGLTVSSVVRNSDRSVTVTTSKHASDTDYPVTINGVLDNANKPTAFAGSIRSLKVKPGVAQFSRWNNETGGFESFGSITRPADSVEQVVEFYSGRELAENYFGRLQAIFTPTTTGNYVFFCSSDDHGELYLSTDANPTNKKKIAQEPSWSDPRLWIGNGTDANTGTRVGANGDIQNRSDQYADSQWAGGPGPIALTAGNQYYIEFLYKEGGGGDSGSATFVVGAGDPVNGETALKGDLLSWYEAAAAVAPTITSITVGADGNVTIVWTGGGQLEASETLGGTYAPIAGATGGTYVWAPGAATQVFARVRN